MKAIQNQGEIKTIKKYVHSDKDLKKYLLNLQLKVLKKQLSQIKKVNPDDLIYKYKGSTADEKFNEFDNTFSLLDKIRNGKISLADAKNDQAEVKLNLSEIKKGN